MIKDFGGVQNLRSWCDHNSTCIGYAVDLSQADPQVWFKAAAGLDYTGGGRCPAAPGFPQPANKWVEKWGGCPYGGHTGSIWTAGKPRTHHRAPALCLRRQP